MYRIQKKLKKSGGKIILLSENAIKYHWICINKLLFNVLQNEVTWGVAYPCDLLKRGKYVNYFPSKLPVSIIIKSKLSEKISKSFFMGMEL